jgi:hypothetical protein
LKLLGFAAPQTSHDASCLDAGAACCATIAGIAGADGMRGSSAATSVGPNEKLGASGRLRRAGMSDGSAATAFIP